MNPHPFPLSAGRAAWLLRGSLAIIITIFLILFTGACSRDTLPTDIEPDGAGQAAAKSLDTFSNASSPDQTVALEMISRTRYLKAEYYAPDETYSRPQEGMFVLERLSAEAPLLTAGMIVMGPCVGPPREIDSVSHIGDKFIIETHPADWGLVSDIGPLRVRIPMGRAAGSNGAVSWGAMELVDAPEGVYLKDLPSDMYARNPPDHDDIFGWLGLGFINHLFCLEGDTSEFCVGLKPEIIEGSCDISNGYADLVIDWKSWDEFCEYVGPWPWNWDCDFNPLKEIKVTVGFESTTELRIGLKGSAWVGVTAPLVTAGKSIRIGRGDYALEGELGLTLNLIANAGIENVEVETGFTLETGMDVDVGWSEARSFYDDSRDAHFDFEPFFEPKSAGNGFVSFGLEPEFGIRLDIFDDDVLSLEASVGVASYLKYQLDLDDPPSGCPNWHIANTGNLDLNFELKLEVADLAVDPSPGWVIPLIEPIDIFQMWGTGDLLVNTQTNGVDLDPDGYRVLVRRSDLEEDPLWEPAHELIMAAQDGQSLSGGNCRYRNPAFYDPNGILDCDLVATQHDLVIDGIMWNCAVEGYAARMRCLEAGEQVAETFSVECVSAYAFLRDEVNAALLDGTVRNQGIARSILAKLFNAEKKRDHGDYQAAMNILSALDNYLAISAGQQVDAAFAQHLSGRVHDIMELFVWPAVTPAPQFADR